jgi:hypothetical protein
MSTLGNNLFAQYYAQSLNQIPTEGLVFYASLDGKTPNVAETGQVLITTGNATYTTFQGIPCLQHTSGTECWIKSEAALQTTQGWTVSTWLAYTRKNGLTWCFGQNMGEEWGRGLHLSIANNIPSILHGGGSGDFGATSAAIVPSPPAWIHVAGIINFETGYAGIYVNGALNISSNVANLYRKNYSEVRFCTDYQGSARAVIGTYVMAGCRIYNRCLTETEIEKLASEFKPTP